MRFPESVVVLWARRLALARLPPQEPAELVQYRRSRRRRGRWWRWGWRRRSRGTRGLPPLGLSAALGCLPVATLSTGAAPGRWPVPGRLFRAIVLVPVVRCALLEGRIAGDPSRA